MTRTKLVRWDNLETIHEADGEICDVVMAATKLGISCLRASLARANLARANLDGANLYGANLYGANLARANLARANLARANLDGASLARANLDGANLDGANLDGANLDGANLARANLARANLDGASLDEASLPIWSRWAVSYRLQPSLVVHIGRKCKTIQDWDAWFAGMEEFDTPRSDERFLRIHANYLAMRAYLVAMGHHTDG